MSVSVLVVLVIVSVNVVNENVDDVAVVVERLVELMDVEVKLLDEVEEEVVVDETSQTM